MMLEKGDKAWWNGDGLSAGGVCTIEAVESTDPPVYTITYASRSGVLPGHATIDHVRREHVRGESLYTLLPESSAWDIPSSRPT